MVDEQSERLDRRQPARLAHGESVVVERSSAAECQERGMVDRQAESTALRAAPQGELVVWSGSVGGVLGREKPAEPAEGGEPEALP